jgi:hypothetical protein
MRARRKCIAKKLHAIAAFLMHNYLSVMLSVLFFCMQCTVLIASSEIGIDEAAKKVSETNKRVRKALGNLGIKAIKSLPKFQMPALQGMTIHLCSQRLREPSR